jgi:hypothetical protein
VHLYTLSSKSRRRSDERVITLHYSIHIVEW